MCVDEGCGEASLIQVLLQSPASSAEGSASDSIDHAQVHDSRAFGSEARIL